MEYGLNIVGMKSSGIRTNNQSFFLFKDSTNVKNEAIIAIFVVLKKTPKIRKIK
ncbi:hypothetical protein [Thermosipho melanesiensis]|uniref:hypothetical protein n=1 Tax=Thermosipho melanesiensis TaxID=46541 RepID=UPI0012DB74B8|nr:hypothetical protein [Thermosipho melanesiensis]